MLIEGWAVGEVLGDFFVTVGDNFVEVVDKTKHMAAEVGGAVTETKRAMAGMVFDTAMKMFLRDNLMHGDLHGGNVLFNATDMKLTVIDVGIICTLTGEEQTTQFVQFLYGMCSAKPAVISDTLLAMSTVPDTIDRAMFAADVAAGLELFVDPATKLSHLDGLPVPVGDVTGEMLRLCNRHRCVLNGEVTTLLMSIAMLEGMLRQLDPSFDMMERAVPYLLRYSPGAVGALSLSAASKGAD